MINRQPIRLRIVNLQNFLYYNVLLDLSRTLSIETVLLSSRDNDDCDNIWLSYYYSAEFFFSSYDSWTLSDEFFFRAIQNVSKILYR